MLLAIHGVIAGVGGFTPIAATGGTILDVEDYRYHKFTSSGTFEITANPAVSLVDVCINAGGTSAYGKQGGGGGEFIALTGQTGAVTTYSIVIGAGGTGNANGSDSSAFGSTASHGTAYGGSLKGATAGNGNLGGQSAQASGNGGGGNGAVGGDATYAYSGYNGGSGGNGTYNLIVTKAAGTTSYPGPGGGGGAGIKWGGGEGWAGGGGYKGGGGGGTRFGAGSSATANTGGGGGGHGNGVSTGQGAGGAGMVVIRYPLVAI